ncbi:hypothetical protein SJ05684_c14340 [Sinorhizobium sojae CCBAU 05684]|uniref:Uncharacterized protein n=1 Tax=Sinorhizobium sojae CCBAU 05684 TaxID=716928 RepID=A0A249PAU3_9HYPH|nr:hypothetical protein SJ05684_c14340 [Sinorhizobium sojae CCBAU 05684]
MHVEAQTLVPRNIGFSGGIFAQLLDLHRRNRIRLEKPV